MSTSSSKKWSHDVDEIISERQLYYMKNEMSHGYFHNNTILHWYPSQVAWGLKYHVHF